MVFHLSQKARSESVRLNACRDILDRVGYYVNKAVVPEADRQLPVPILIHLPLEIAKKHGIEGGTPACWIVQKIIWPQSLRE